MKRNPLHTKRPWELGKTRLQNRGVSLIVVMVLLVVIAGLGFSAVQISLMGERGVRNDRDYQVAWQAAEAALMDAEFDIRGPNSSGSARMDSFSTNNLTSFLANCGTSGPSRGLCMPAATGQPVWLTVDFTDTSTLAPSTAFGSFTGRGFAAGSSGLMPRKAPRYIIEALPDTASHGDASIGAAAKYVYRVTAMGFGPRDDIQAVMQMLFRK